MIIKLNDIGPGWHRWFAWRPVIADIGGGRDGIVWLRWVEVDYGHAPCFTYDYRLPGLDNNHKCP